MAVDVLEVGRIERHAIVRPVAQGVVDVCQHLEHARRLDHAGDLGQVVADDLGGWLDAETRRELHVGEVRCLVR